MNTSVSHIRAIFFAFTGFTLWVLSDTSMKMAGEANLPPYETLAFLGFFGVIFLLIRAAVTGTIRRLMTSKPRKQIGRALLSLIINLCNIIALKHIPLTMFYVTVFTAPIIISLLAVPLLHERLNRLRVIAVICGFVGVVIAINPLGKGNHGDWLGYGAALTGVFFFSLCTLWVRLMAQNETPDSLAFFSCLVEMIGGGIFMLIHTNPLTFNILIILIIMSLFCVMGNLFNYLALKHTTAATVSQFHYTQIIVGAIIGYYLWDEIPTFHLLIGTLLIIGSGLIVILNKPATNIGPTNPL